MIQEFKELNQNVLVHLINLKITVSVKIVLINVAPVNIILKNVFYVLMKLEDLILLVNV